MTLPNFEIAGSGRHLPGEAIDNHRLTRVLDTNDAWIQKRTGICQRHFAELTEGPSDLAVPAAVAALKDAGLDKDAVDYVVFATMTPESFIPGPGGVFAAKLGIPGVPCLDIRQQCAAIPFALQLCHGLFATGAAKTILLVGAEAHAPLMPWNNWAALREADAPIDADDRKRASEHRGYGVVFGDGAGALVLRRCDEPGRGLLGTKLRTDGRDADFLEVDAPYRHLNGDRDVHGRYERSLPRMNGQGLFKRAVRELPKLVTEVCEETGVPTTDIDCFLAHQANDRINGAVRQSMGLAADKMPSNIARYGNTSAATIPILIDEQRHSGNLNPGDLICLIALGAGLNFGATLFRV